MGQTAWREEKGRGRSALLQYHPTTKVESSGNTSESDIDSTATEASSSPQPKRVQLPTSGPLESPSQPVINFPQSKGRRFSVRYYSIHQWIEYSEAEDAVYDFSCRNFCSESAVRSGETFGNQTFIDKGFKKWKYASVLFQQHENKMRSRSLMQMSVTSLLKSKRKHVKKLLKVVSFIGRQGLTFRGHKESETSENKGNFLEMLETVCEEDPKLKERISHRYGHYCSPEYQNDLISVYSLRILRYITEKAKEAGF
ncbi:hypothetical protein PR048_001490 [Dryococelus australis]|uniref:DUF4371 domain-containing protein n=1 Tax=Dryococelus australis TaxID=614101 RepID=A0ABQ9IHH9_9NEOP|nr:hypothetical protein PR048_001490 [Dryococelus australis]